MGLVDSRTGYSRLVVKSAKITAHAHLIEVGDQMSHSIVIRFDLILKSFKILHFRLRNDFVINLLKSK